MKMSIVVKDRTFLRDFEDVFRAAQESAKRQADEKRAILRQADDDYKRRSGFLKFVKFEWLDSYAAYRHAELKGVPIWDVYDDYVYASRIGNQTKNCLESLFIAVDQVECHFDDDFCRAFKDSVTYIRLHGDPEDYEKLSFWVDRLARFERKFEK